VSFDRERSTWTPRRWRDQMREENPKVGVAALNWPPSPTRCIGGGT
jgi:hypothetical protein